MRQECILMDVKRRTHYLKEGETSGECCWEVKKRCHDLDECYFSGGTGRRPSSSELTREWEVRKWRQWLSTRLGRHWFEGEKRIVGGRWRPKGIVLIFRNQCGSTLCLSVGMVIEIRNVYECEPGTSIHLRGKVLPYQWSPLVSTVHPIPKNTR